MSTKITKTNAAAARVLISSIEFLLQDPWVDIALGNTNYVNTQELNWTKENNCTMQKSKRKRIKKIKMHK